MYKSAVAAATFVLALNAWGASETATTAVPVVEPAAREQVDLELARAGFERYLAAWNGSVSAASMVNGVFAEQASIELSLPGRPEWALRIDGPAAIEDYVGAMHELAGQWNFSTVQYYPTLQAGVVFAQFEADGASRHLHKIVIIEMDGSRITRLRDLNGATLTLEALTDPVNGSRLPRRMAQN